LTKIGRPEELIPLIHKEFPVNAVVYHQEVTKEETDVEAVIDTFCKANAIAIQKKWGATLYNPQDMSFDPQKR